MLVLTGLCASPSQHSFSDCQTSLRPRSVSSVTWLDLTFPAEGSACLGRMMNSCSQIEELTVKCNSKGEQLQCACAPNATGCTQGPVYCPSVVSLLPYTYHVAGSFLEQMLKLAQMEISIRIILHFARLAMPLTQWLY